MFVVMKGVSQMMRKPDSRKGSLIQQYIPRGARAFASDDRGPASWRGTLNLWGPSVKALIDRSPARTWPVTIAHRQVEGTT